MKHRLVTSALILASLVAVADGAYGRTRPRAARENAAELFRRAEEAADAYQFDEAAELLEKCSDAIPARGKSPVDEAELDILRRRVERGQLMMDRVEKIIVIDSIAVPRKAFFRHYRIDTGAGSLRDASVLPDGVEAIEETSVFVPESGLSMMWAAPDTAGQAVIAEMSLLADGSYEPVVCHPELNIEAEDGSPVDALFPFLMADGVTLYYASDNPELSLGGYDIFFSRRDGDTFMQPQNMGMPYNSPANDYLLAIDEITGTGWWATDRNSPDSDSLTIYRFIPNELRVNYNSDDTPELASLARLANFRATQPAGADYSELLAKPLRASGEKSAPAFRIAIPGRGVVTSLDRLRTSQGRAAARQWIELKQRLADDTSRLAALRRDYAAGHHDAESRIRALERSVPALRAEITERLNDIVRAESR